MAEVKISTEGNLCSIRILGRMDIQASHSLRMACTAQTQEGLHYVIDLAEVEFMDSTALATLLMLRKHIEEHQGSILLSRPPPVIREIFRVAGLDQIFEIDDGTMVFV
jgi:anti-anti-sigma factor